MVFVGVFMVHLDKLYSGWPRLAESHDQHLEIAIVLHAGVVVRLDLDKPGANR